MTTMHSEEINRIATTVAPYTMTLPQGVNELVRLVQRAIEYKISGAFVECGVWRGGSMMAIAMALRSLGVDDRELYLFDTFEGMTPPEPVDIDLNGAAAIVRFNQEKTRGDKTTWCYAPLDDVKARMASTNYPTERIHYVVGKVEETLPPKEPKKIAILRLDTDFYSSTKHELETMYPRISHGGVVIIDDYGHWRGSKKATDEYLEQHAPDLALLECGYSVRIGIKP